MYLFLTETGKMGRIKVMPVYIRT